MTPVIFSFTELTFIEFKDFTNPSSHFRLAFNQVQYYFSAKLKPGTCKTETSHMQCTDESAILFESLEMALSASCRMSKALFPAG
jgi:hypothetical protein